MKDHSITTSENAAEMADRWRKLIRESDYPSYCRNILFSFIELSIEREWSQAVAARNVKHGAGQKPLSGAALSQLLNGSYKADPVGLCRAIEKTLNQERARELFAVSGFVETGISKVIEELADVAMITQRIACLHGAMLEGKTTNAIALAGRYNRASCVFMTMPYADSYGGFVRRLASTRGVNMRGSISDLRERILQTFDETHLLIFDEFHQPLITYARGQSLRVMEFIREINDLRRCGILLVGSSAGYAVLSTDPNFARIAASINAVDLAAQIRDKDGLRYSRDLAAVLKSFKIEPTPDAINYLSGVADDHSVARVFDVLRLASGRASHRKQPLTWQHVIDVAKPTLKLAA